MLTSFHFSPAAGLGNRCFIVPTEHTDPQKKKLKSNKTQLFCVCGDVSRGFLSPQTGGGRAAVPGKTQGLHIQYMILHPHLQNPALSNRQVLAEENHLLNAELSPSAGMHSPCIHLGFPQRSTAHAQEQRHASPPRRSRKQGQKCATGTWIF